MILGKLFPWVVVIPPTTVNYIACDGTSEIYTSTDGLRYTAVTPSGVNTGDLVYCAYYDGSVWYLGTNDGLYYSTDGALTWSWHNAILTSIYSITYDGTNYLVAGAGASYDVAYSSSLTGTFTGATGPFTNNASWICANTTGTVIATGSGAYTNLRRTIGVWYFTNDVYSTRGNAVVWHVDKFVSVGIGTYTLGYSSSSGASWTGLTKTNLTEGLCVASNGSVVVVGGSTTDGKSLFYSSDGITWTNYSGAVGSISAIFWDGSRFIAVTQVSVFTSTNGSTWTNQYEQIPSSVGARSIYSNTI